MNEIFSIQKVLFQQIKDKLPANISFVDEISELLNISYDSAYRRIRGEKSLSIEELKKLSTNYGISVDLLFGVSSDNIIFNYKSLNSETFNFEQYLTSISDDLKRIQSSKEKEMIYLAKDIPIFHNYQFPELAAFKEFFWHKTILQFPEYEEKLFSLDETRESSLKIGKQLINTYIKIPSAEIWNEETINSLLRQIEFYYESGFFAKKEHALLLFESTAKLISHIQKQAELGFKFLYEDNEPTGIENSFKLYHSEVMLGDDTIFITMDNIKQTCLIPNVLSLLITTNPSFCNETHNLLKNLMKRANLLSTVSEKQRNKFFLKLHENLNQFKAKII